MEICCASAFHNKKKVIASSLLTTHNTFHNKVCMHGKEVYTANLIVMKGGEGLFSDLQLAAEFFHSVARNTVAICWMTSITSCTVLCPKTAAAFGRGSSPFWTASTKARPSSTCRVSPFIIRVDMTAWVNTSRSLKESTFSGLPRSSCLSETLMSASSLDTSTSSSVLALRTGKLGKLSKSSVLTKTELRAMQVLVLQSSYNM